MVDWIKINFSTIIVSLFLLFIIGLITKSLIKKHTCGHGCTSCGLKGSCHPKSKEQIIKEMRNSL